MNRSLQNGPLISVVIPLYCEGSNLKQVISEIQSYIDPMNESYEIILIDDGSMDNTWDIIVEESKTCPMIRAVRLSRNFGKESALSAGLEMAGGSAIIVMDGDLQHPPSIIPEMLRLWRDSEADVVETVKNSRGKETALNKLGAKFFYNILKKLSGYDLTNLSDYKLMDSKVVKAWLQMGERNLFFRGMSEWLGFKRVRISFDVPKRASGKSAMSYPRLIKLAITAITSFSSLPLHIITFIGVIFLIFAFIMIIQTLYMKFVGLAITGFTTVILLQLIIGSLLMISLGIIGEYIARIYYEVKGRPRYIVEQRIDSKTKNRNP